jgi:hypothetical protein
LLRAIFSVLSCNAADAGYCSDANLAALEERDVDAYIAPGRAKHAGEGEGGGARVAAMRAKIKAGEELTEAPRQLRRPSVQIGFDRVDDRSQLMLIALLGVEPVGDDHRPQQPLR